MVLPRISTAVSKAVPASSRAASTASAAPAALKHRSLRQIFWAQRKKLYLTLGALAAVVSAGQLMGQKVHFRKLVESTDALHQQAIAMEQLRLQRALSLRSEICGNGSSQLQSAYICSSLEKMAVDAQSRIDSLQTAAANATG